MVRAHIIESGDWLGELAERYGIGHWSHIWNDAANAELREQRGSPDLVMIGDVVQIPDAPPHEVEVPAGRRAVFVVSSSPAVLRIRVSALGRFLDFFGPVEYELVAGDASVSGTIVDDDQILEVPLHATVRSAVLTLMGRERYELDIGGLGPASEHRGALARLESLGFAVDVTTSADDPEKAQVVDPVSAALLAFQSRMGLTRTGELDEPTRRTLTDMYGA